MVFNGPGGRHDGDNGNDHLAVLVKDLNGDKGRSLLDAVAAEIPGFATKVERNQGLSAAMAACVSGVARVSSDTQQMQNRYTEIKNSHQLGRAPDTRIVENLRASCYDPPMARLRELIEPRGVVAFQDGKYRQGYRRMQEFDHGQLLVHSYGKQGIFKNHFDQNSQVVCLHAVGNTCDFAVCFSDKCERHGSVDKETCPHCHVFKFESGDTLIFDASFDQQIGVCHGVVKILDEVAEGAAEKLPPYMKNKRVSIQWRGRRPEAVGDRGRARRERGHAPPRRGPGRPRDVPPREGDGGDARAAAEQEGRRLTLGAGARAPSAPVPPYFGGVHDDAAQRLTRGVRNTHASHRRLGRRRRRPRRVLELSRGRSRRGRSRARASPAPTTSEERVRLRVVA